MMFVYTKTSNVFVLDLLAALLIIIYGMKDARLLRILLWRQSGCVSYKDNMLQ